jgi:16S rRNA processing protein RimM
MAAAEQWAWLARIRRTQGRKGEVFAEILTDFPEKFAERAELWLIHAPTPGSSEPLPTRVDLTAHWRHKDGVVLHFAGIDSISAAEALVGRVVAIPRPQRMRLGEGEAYIGDLIGCTLVNVAGPLPVDVGRIADVDRSAGAAPLLIVRGASGEILVPFARSYLHRLDLEGRRVEMALPEGLVDLNRETGLRQKGQ